MGQMALKQALYQRPRGRDVDKFVVRLPDGMRSDIAERARGHKRSMNSEIIDMLSRAFGEQPNSETRWNPSVGNLVTYNEKPYVIKSFAMGKNGLYVTLESVSPTLGAFEEPPQHPVVLLYELQPILL